jgi:hypothetical protein
MVGGFGLLHAPASPRHTASRAPRPRPPDCKRARVLPRRGTCRTQPG